MFSNALQGIPVRCILAKVSIKSTEYYCGKFVVLKCVNVDLMLGHILAIAIIAGNDHILVCESFHGKYLPDLGIFELDQGTDEIFLTSVGELADFYPLSAYEKNGQKYVILKHHVSPQ